MKGPSNEKEVLVVIVKKIQNETEKTNQNLNLIIKDVKQKR
jgi:hypothetical protein